MYCLKCHNSFNSDLPICPHCGESYNIELRRFLQYIGEPTSLFGYQKSYKLVLLRSILSSLITNKGLLVDQIMESVRQFYLQRAQSGDKPEYDADERIQLISEQTSIHDIWAVFKPNAYSAINNQGFLFLEKSESGQLFFVFNKDLSVNLSIFVCSSLLILLDKKIDLYYSKQIASNLISDQTEVSVQTLEKNEVTTPHLISLESIPLSTRSLNGLRRMGYKYIQDLFGVTREELLKARNLGNKSIDEILSVIKDYSEYDSSEDVSLIVNEKELNSQSKNEVKEALNPLDCLIKDSDLSIRAINILTLNGFQSIRDLLSITGERVMRFRGAGNKTINEIASFIEKTATNNDITLNSSPFWMIHTECEDIPVSLLTEYGLPHSCIYFLQRASINTLKELKDLTLFQLIHIVNIKWSEILSFDWHLFSSGIKEATGYLFDRIWNKYKLHFVVRRSHGATLQDIADAEGLTRERVRQCLNNALIPLQSIVACLFHILLKKRNGHYLSLQDLYDIFDNDDYDAIISYTLSDCAFIEEIPCLNMFFLKQSTSINRILQEIIKEYVGEGIFWNKNIEILNELLVERNVSFFDANDIWTYMIYMGYHFYGDYVTPEKLSYGFILSLIVDSDFPYGINFSDETAINHLLEIAKNKYGLILLPENNRATISRLQHFLILCDRGKWISPNRIVISQSILTKIKEYIDSSTESQLYYQSLFNRFSGLLTLTSNINNYNFLHGVLRYFYGSIYSFKKDYLIKSSASQVNRLEKQIYQFIAMQGTPVTRKKLKEHFNITSDTIIATAIYSDASIFQWENNCYNCAANLHLSDEDTVFLGNKIEEFFLENNNYCSAKLIYDFLKQGFPEICCNNNVKNPMNLFYMLSSVLHNKYRFRFPHILPIDSSFTCTEDIIRSMIGTPKYIECETIEGLYSKYGWGSSALGNDIENLLSNYYRIAKNTYLLKEEFNISEYAINCILEQLQLEFGNEYYLANWKLDYSKFPDIGFEWNVYLLQTIINNYLNVFGFITTNYGTNRLDRSILVLKSKGISSFDSLVVDLMIRNGYIQRTEEQMYSLLVLSEIIQHSVPKELKTSSLFKYENGTYTIKEAE